MLSRRPPPPPVDPADRVRELLARPSAGWLPPVTEDEPEPEPEPEDEPGEELKDEPGTS